MKKPEKNILAFLKIVPYLEPMSNRLIILLAKGYEICPESLTKLIQFAKETNGIHCTDN